MEIEIIRNTVAQGVVVEVGAKLDLHPNEARDLIRAGKARVPAAEPPPPFGDPAGGQPSGASADHPEKTGAAMTTASAPALVAGDNGKAAPAESGKGKGK